METHELPNLKARQLIGFWNHVDRTGEHWIWTGKLTGNNEMPSFYLSGFYFSARRIAWKFAPGKRAKLKPEKPYLAVTCGQRLCVNPAHLIPVRRGGSPRKNECARGHKLTPENVYMTSQGKRACRACIRMGLASRRKRYLAEGRGWGRNYRPRSSPNGDGKPDTVPRQKR